MSSENGWEPSKVGAESLEWVTVPGTNVHLQLMKGWPLAMLRAVAADFNAYIEPLRDADSAAWTPTNSVATSNHLNGTAMDLNWNSHPFHVRGTFTPDQMVTLRELLDFYQGMIFWAGDWDDPVDEMHWQMGYDTYNNPSVGDFINRKIRPDGFSTFRRGDAPERPPQPSGDAGAAAVLADAMGDRDGVDYAAKLSAVRQCLAECDCTTVDRIAMWASQVGHESAGLFYMEEIASGDAYEGRTDLGNTQPGDGHRYKGRGPLQVTGRHNYTALSTWAFDQGLVPSHTFFVDDPEQLASDEYGFIGVTWYWSTQRPMNDAADARDLERATRYVNGGLNGLADRRSRYDHCIAMGETLLTINSGDDWLMALSDDEQRELLDKTREVWNQLRGFEGHGWKQLGKDANGNDLTMVDALAAVKKKLGA